MAAGSLLDMPSPSESSESTSPAAYRPHLDGLRAVAVYLVVFFHAGSTQLSAGYIGVDIFFVLSGFLVTQLLLRDIASRGSIRFGRFYSRRFRRLLPAAFVTLIVTGVVYTAVASPVEVSNAIGAFKAAFLYSTNWYFIHQASNYFAPNIAMNPVLHFWSLAVEEQFYLVWPLALGGVFALTRRLDSSCQMRTIRFAVALGAFVSVIWALSLRASNPNRAYYGTDTRAYELLAGAFLALTPALVDAARRFRRVLRSATLLSVVALLVLSSSWVDYNAIIRGVTVTITTCVLILAVEAADGGLVKRAFSTRSIVYLGKISYGTYLWHWLVILVIFKTVHISSIATIAIACLVATALASLSFEMLERPIRMSALFDRHRRAVIATGLAISIVSALVLIPKIVNPASATAPVVRSSTPAILTPIPKHLDLKPHSVHECSAYTKPVSACTLVKGKRPSVLLMGDSEADMMIPLFIRLAQTEDLTLFVNVKGGCPWQRDLFTSISFDKCKRQKEDLYKRVIPTLRPDIVVVVNLSIGQLGPNGLPTRWQAAIRATTASLAALRAAGSKVLLIEPLPSSIDFKNPLDPLACLSKARYLEECRYRAANYPSRIALLYRRLATQDTVRSLDLGKAVCPSLPICDPIINGLIVKQDPIHPTIEFSRSLAPLVDLYLKRVGFLAPTPK